MSFVLLDVGGVLVLPDFSAIGSLLSERGRGASEGDLDRAHYSAVVSLDNAFAADGYALVIHYVQGFLVALGPIDAQHDPMLHVVVEEAFRAERLPWPRVIPGTVDGMLTLRRLGHRLAIVSNSLGHVETRLRELRICQVGEGEGVPVDAVIDSFHVGVEKPDPRIFYLACDEVGCEPADAVHIGDSLVYDVRGAEAAGIRPLHFDPGIFALTSTTNTSNRSSMSRNSCDMSPLVARLALAARREEGLGDGSVGCGCRI